MIAGCKLLLADDSVAIQKVIDLTFTDEGMQVTTVGDGHGALEYLSQFKPDVVLADVFMPGVDGYELCKFIKQNERFRGVPVMLLVGSFEPFDEAEARRAGADDVVTKPFQSIRDLVKRVGSLVGHKDAAPRTPEHHDAAIAMAHPSAHAARSHSSEGTWAGEAATAEQPVTVFVEAPMMESAEAAVAQEHSCPPDLELQTADTRQLQPVFERNGEEIQTNVYQDMGQKDQGLRLDDQRAASADDDGVLDLGEIDNFASASATDDFELDLDVAPVDLSGQMSMVSAAPVTERSVSSSDVRVHEPIAANEQPAAFSAPQSGSEPASMHTNGDLSPHVIEAISRRVVEQLSEKVVREIAWEIIPELSELLIKQRLQQRD